MTSTEGNLRYTETGRGGPVVLLDWTPWPVTALADALAARYRVINVELPETDADGGQAGSAQEVAEAAARVAETAGLDSYTLVGTSLGADVAFRLALLRPGAVAALALVSPSCVLPTEPPRWDTPAQGAATMLAHPENAAHPPPDSVRLGRVAALTERWRNAGGDDAAAMLAELRCPTLAVFGQEDRLVSREAARLWRERAPNCNVCFIYDAGHAIAVERPDALTNVVLDYVERRETFIVENRSGLINP